MSLRRSVLSPFACASRKCLSTENAQRLIWDARASPVRQGPLQTALVDDLSQSHHGLPEHEQHSFRELAILQVLRAQAYIPELRNRKRSTPNNESNRQSDCARNPGKRETRCRGSHLSRMKVTSGSIRLSASDVSNHLACHHLASLDLAVALSARPAPAWRSPNAECFGSAALRTKMPVSRI